MTEGNNWIYTTNIYEVNVRQYTAEGTFKAFQAHLPRLREMAVHTIWFMPITPIAKKEMKGSMGSPYACSDYVSINPEFGTLADFKELVNEAHRLGMKVIIDWVANHTGWDHVWTREHPDWYKHDQQTGTFNRASGMDDIIELDYSNPAMRHGMTDAMKYWVNECDIDGFRCDLASWVQVDYWLEAIPQVNAIRPLFWLAEADPLDSPEYMQVFDAAYTWTWMHKTADLYKNGMQVEELVRMLERYQAGRGLEAWFTTNHDENTWNGTEYEKYGDAALTFAVHALTWPGIPLIYSGQEMPNHKRLAFFDKDPIEWNGKFELADFYRTFFTLRQQHPALDSRSDVQLLQTSSPQQILAYRRKKDQHEVIVVLNFSASPANFSLTIDTSYNNFQSALTADRVDPKTTFQLQPWEFQVLHT